jgi:hypothetical protein
MLVEEEDYFVKFQYPNDILHRSFGDSDFRNFGSPAFGVSSFPGQREEATNWRTASQNERSWPGEDREEGEGTERLRIHEIPLSGLQTPPRYENAFSIPEGVLETRGRERLEGRQKGAASIRRFFIRGDSRTGAGNFTVDGGEGESGIEDQHGTKLLQTLGGHDFNAPVSASLPLLELFQAPSSSSLPAPPTFSSSRRPEVEEDADLLRSSFGVLEEAETTSARSLVGSSFEKLLQNLKNSSQKQTQAERKEGGRATGMGAKYFSGKANNSGIRNSVVFPDEGLLTGLEFWEDLDSAMGSRSENKTKPATLGNTKPLNFATPKNSQVFQNIQNSEDSDLRLIFLSEFNPYITKIRLQLKVIFKSELIHWKKSLKHKEGGCFFFVEMMDAKVRFSDFFFSEISSNDIYFFFC